MTLNDWIAEEAERRGIKRAAAVTAIAGELGISRGYLMSLARGALRPAPKLARRIEAMTSGVVSAVELVFGPWEDAHQGGDYDRPDAA